MSAPVSRTDSGIIALTVAAVPTGMKAGVRTCPRGVDMTPARADPSVALSSKPNNAVIRGPCVENTPYPTNPAPRQEGTPHDRHARGARNTAIRVGGMDCAAGPRGARAARQGGYRCAHLRAACFRYRDLRLLHAAQGPVYRPPDPRARRPGDPVLGPDRGPARGGIVQR